MTSGVSGPPTTVVLADADRRFYAFALDRLIAWTVYAAAVLTLAAPLFRRGSTLLAVVVLAAAVIVVWFLDALLTGLRGVTPGKRLAGLRVVSSVDGRPIGLGPALLRQGVLGVLTLPTAGLGTASLAWAATADPSGRRRGFHDRLARTVVIDVRRRAAPVADPTPGEHGLVNLTALRLRPVPEVASDPAATRPRQPAAYSPPQAGARWRVRFDTGETFVVTGLALVGRGPEPEPGEQIAHLVALASHDLSLSTTHAQFQVTPEGSLVVMDRGSIHGTTLVRRGAIRALGARKPATLLDEDRVRFGDREMIVRREA